MEATALQEAYLKILKKKNEESKLSSFHLIKPTMHARDLQKPMILDTSDLTGHKHRKIISSHRKTPEWLILGFLFKLIDNGPSLPLFALAI